MTELEIKYIEKKHRKDELPKTTTSRRAQITTEDVCLR